MSLDWKLFAVVAAVIVAVLMTLTWLATKQLVPGDVAGGAATTALGFIIGWVQKQPVKGGVQ